MKVIHGDVDLDSHHLTELPDLSDVTVEGYFECYDNHLKSLKGAPKVVKGNFFCSRNQLEDLKGAPEYVGGSFICRYNKLTSLEGCPKEVRGDFVCTGNPIKFTEEQVRAVCKVGKQVY
jgi:hypothetical protein